MNQHALCNTDAFLYDTVLPGPLPCIADVPFHFVLTEILTSGITGDFCRGSQLTERNDLPTSSLQCSQQAE